MPLTGGSGRICVELRRHHDEKDLGARKNNKEFRVTQRFPPIAGTCAQVYNKGFGTYPEADRYWREKVMILKDQGLKVHEMTITGFREEGRDV